MNNDGNDKWAIAKHMLISILVGATVSFMTAFLQGLIGALHTIPTGLPGAAAGVVTYLSQWRNSYYG